MTDLVRVDVLAVAGTDVTVGIPDGRGGQATVVLSPPYTSPQFIPDVGSTALLLMNGPIPKLMPESIAADAITAREIEAGSITAEHIMAGAVDGQTITGATIQTAATGARIVQDANGLRLINAAGGTVVDFSTLTGNALVTGVTSTAVMGERIEVRAPGPLGQVSPGILFIPASGDNPARIATQSSPTIGGMLISSGFDTPENWSRYSSVWVKETGTIIASYGSSSGSSSANAKVVVDYGGVGFQGKVGFNFATPIAKQTLPAAATDLASVIALTNAIRTALINYGLAS